MSTNTTQRAALAERAPAAPVARTLADIPLVLLTAALTGITIFSLVGAIAPGLWQSGSYVVVAIVALISLVVGRTRAPWGIVVLVQVVAVIAGLTLVFFPRDSLLGVVPTLSTLEQASAATTAAIQEIMRGIAPIVPSPNLVFLLMASTGVLAIVLDIVIVWGRLPLLGGIVAIVVALISPLIVPAPVNVTYWAVLMIVLFVILRRSSDLSDRTLVPQPQRAGVSFAAITAVSVVAAVAFAPLIDGPKTQIIPGFGPAMSITPSLNLGSNLRQPRETVLLSYTTTLPSAPYLRIASLTQYSGDTWVPDEDSESVPLTSWPEYATVDSGPGIEVQRSTTAVSVENVDLGWLPVPYPASVVAGAAGNWSISPVARTILGGEQASASGQKYTVTTDVPRPTSEQIRASSARSAQFADLAELPVGTPDIVSTLAREVTAGATNDFDRLVALQTWFRSSEFTYSLDAPVDAGYDGDSLGAVERFLEVKAGYCAHFASAFTLMARSLDMPARIIVGFLPGQSDGTVDGLTKYTVTSGKMHAWPEVYFDGIGWIAFEPTQSLGTPTTFASGEIQNTAAPEVPQTPAATQAPNPEVPEDSAGPTSRPTGAGTDSESGVAWWPFAVGVVGVVVLLLLPAGTRWVLARRRHALARRGDAVASWREAVALLVDYGGNDAPDGTPRDVGAQLATLGADAGAVKHLVTAIERASYGADSSPADGEKLASALESLTASLRATRSPRAVFLPRSLMPAALRSGTASAAEPRENARAPRP